MYVHGMGKRGKEKGYNDGRGYKLDEASNFSSEIERDWALVFFSRSLLVLWGFVVMSKGILHNLVLMDKITLFCDD